MTMGEDHNHGLVSPDKRRLWSEQGMDFLLSCVSNLETPQLDQILPTSNHKWQNEQDQGISWLWYPKWSDSKSTNGYPFKGAGARGLKKANKLEVAKNKNRKEYHGFRVRSIDHFCWAHWHWLRARAPSRRPGQMHVWHHPVVFEN